jgi:hypothetical protein
MEWCCLPYHSLPPDIPTLRWVANVMLANLTEEGRQRVGKGICNHLIGYNALTDQLLATLEVGQEVDTAVKSRVSACLSANECHCLVYVADTKLLCGSRSSRFHMCIFILQRG